MSTAGVQSSEQPQVNSKELNQIPVNGDTQESVENTTESKNVTVDLTTAEEGDEFDLCSDEELTTNTQVSENKAAAEKNPSQEPTPEQEEDIHKDMPPLEDEKENIYKAEVIETEKKSEEAPSNAVEQEGGELLDKLAEVQQDLTKSKENEQAVETKTVQTHNEAKVIVTGLQNVKAKEQAAKEAAKEAKEAKLSSSADNVRPASPPR